jgi:hypothetical protein
MVSSGEWPECPCEHCNPPNPVRMRFTMCPVCGNKRCPKGTFHVHDCTGSNEVGQKGSSWEHVPRWELPDESD